MVELEDFRNKKSVILDTCLIIYELIIQHEKRLIEFCNNNTTIITSFNVEELKKISKKVHEKKKIKEFLEKAKINIIEIPVSLGQIQKERQYVNDTNDELLKKIHDPSDAVLVAAAIKSGSDIITRDKHHLFTTQLEQELHEYGLKVYNDLSKFN